MSELVPLINIESRIHLIRGKKVMLDSDLAALYEVETGQFKRAVRRNIDRFPEDFMFELTKEEQEILRCQIGTLRWGEHPKYLPFAFTEQGVAMLSGVLNSKRAVMINIQIMRAFVRMRNLVTENSDLRKAIQNIERRLGAHDQQIMVAFAALKSLMQPKPVDSQVLLPKKRMGFGKEEKKEPLGRKQISRTR